MVRLRFVVLGLLSGCALATMAASCTVNFVAPKKAESTSSQTFALNSGDSVEISNEFGTTSVSVDPTATQATLTITRTAYAGTDAAANDLLSSMDVSTNHAGGKLTISAQTPPAVSEDSSEFQMVVTENSVVINGLFVDVQVASYRLVLTLPPGHAVAATQDAGLLLADSLDTASTLTADAATIRTSSCAAALTIQNDAGSIDVNDHIGSISADVSAGDIDIEIDSVADTDTVVANVATGGIDIDLPSTIDADLDAQAQIGSVSFTQSQFNSATVTTGPSGVQATLNNGGASIDLDVAVGNITITGK